MFSLTWPQTPNCTCSKYLLLLQALLAQFSAANSRLAVENDKLRTGGPELARESTDVLHEIQRLRGRLTMLEGAAAQLERSSPSVPHTGNLDSSRAASLTPDSQAGYVIRIFEALTLHTC